MYRLNVNLTLSLLALLSVCQPTQCVHKMISSIIEKFAACLPFKYICFEWIHFYYMQKCDISTEHHRNCNSSWWQERWVWCVCVFFWEMQHLVLKCTLIMGKNYLCVFVCVCVCVTKLGVSENGNNEQMWVCRFAAFFFVFFVSSSVVAIAVVRRSFAVLHF